MHVHYGDHSKTLLQWQKQGKIVKDGEKGEELWINFHCPGTAVYYDPSQVRPMTDSELADFKESERAKRRSYYQRIKKMKQTVRKMVERGMNFDEIERYMDEINCPESVYYYAGSLYDDRAEKLEKKRMLEQEEWRKNNSDIIGSRDLIVLDTENRGNDSGNCEYPAFC